MGQKNPKGSVSITNDSGRFRLRWRYQKKRYSFNLTAFTKQNLLQAKKAALQIEQDIATGQFDASLNAYKPTSSHPTPCVAKTMVEYFEEWVRDYRNMSCERDVDYHSTRAMLRKWGNFMADSVVSHLNQEPFGPKTYNRRLGLLKAFFLWTKKKGITAENPLEDVLPKKVKKSPVSSRKPFTQEEIKRILTAIRNDTYCSASSTVKHSYYYPFLYFLFQTGVRNGEAIGLRVQHIDLSANRIHIKESLSRSLKGTHAAARLRKGTKTGKHRELPLSDDLRAVLVPLLKDKGPDRLVFESPKGLPIDDHMFQKRIFAKVLDQLGIEHRVLYAIRHTLCSRFIQEGINPVTVAFWLGNSPQTALRNYTHLTGLPSEVPKVF